MSHIDRTTADAKIQALVDRLIERGIAGPWSIKGCSPAEIDEVEADAGLELPIVYRAFLSRLGSDAGNFFLGSDLYYPTIVGMTADAHQLVAEDPATLALPPDAFVFSMHQGYQFLFFQAWEGDDPAVFYYLELSGKFVKKANSFSEFLMDAALGTW